MKKLLLLFIALSLFSCAKQGSPCLHKFRGDWDYDAEKSPEHWSEINKKYRMCKAGKHQSPVDINPREHITVEDEDFDLHYFPSELNVVNTGHTIEVDYHQGSFLHFEGEQYNLLQFHFHAPSEHTVNRKNYPMEIHLVHKRADGKLLILASFIAKGEHNDFFDSIWSDIPEEKNTFILDQDEEINLANVFESFGAAYYYSGSLTTPPCSEKVQWIVLKNPIYASEDQINEFRHYYSHNARKTQRG